MMQHITNKPLATPVTAGPKDDLYNIGGYIAVRNETDSIDCGSEESHL